MLSLPRLMSQPAVAGRCIMLFALLAGASAAQGQQKPALDVPFVPTPQVVVERMLSMAAVKNGDVLYDLGSGDGRIVITAARKYGARGVGIDLDPNAFAKRAPTPPVPGLTARLLSSRATCSRRTCRRPMSSPCTCSTV